MSNDDERQLSVKHQISWMLSSDNKAVEEDDEQTDEAIKQFCAKKQLASIFAARHPNLLSVVIVLMNEYDLQLAVAAPFLDPEEKYIKTGISDECPFDIKLISPYMITAVGSIEKVLIAALQIFFANGNKNGKGTDYLVHKLSSKNVCVVTISFKINGVNIKVKLLQHQKVREICIYIKD